MPAPKNKYNVAVEVVAREYFGRLKERYKNRNDTTDELADAWLLEQKRSGSYSWTNSQELWTTIENDPRVKQVKQYKSGNFNNDWWKRRMLVALPNKCKHGSSRGAIERPIGSVTSFAATNTKSGSALEADQKGLGLNKIFDCNTQLAIRVSEALLIGSDESIEGCYRDFNSESASLIAVNQVTSLLEKCVAKFDNVQMNDILAGCNSVSQFIEKYRNNCLALSILTDSLVKAEAEVLVLSQTTDAEYIRARSGDIFLGLVNVIVTYDDIKGGLLDGTFGRVLDKHKEDQILSSVFKETEVQTCVGSRVRRGLPPEAFEQCVTTDGSYVVVQYSSNDTLIIDMNAQSDPSNLDREDDTDPDLYKKIPIPGTNRFARVLKIGKYDDDGLTTFKLYLREKDGSQKQWSLHRLLSINLESKGRGLRYSEIVRQHLGLKPGQSFEDHERFKVSAVSEGGIRRMKAKFAYLKRKGWDDVPFAKWCDIDHMAGRSQMWMNNTLFTVSCSHSWNQYMSYVRFLFGHWGFGCGKCKYITGND